MKKRDYIVLGVGVLCIAITLIVGITYAYWRLSQVQTDTNVVNTSCFEIEFSEGEAITLNDAFPMSDEQGLQRDPFTFTITNTCETWTEYHINLETLKQVEGATVLPDEYIRVDLQEGTKSVANSKLIESIKTAETLDNAVAAYKLYYGTLKPNQSKTYNLRLWMDKDVGLVSNSMNASFQSKITIEFSAIQGDETDSENPGGNDNENENQGLTVELVDGVDGTTIGDEVAIGEEHFYVIASDTNKITLLTKYNLEVIIEEDGARSVALVQKQAPTPNEYGIPFAEGNYTDGGYWKNFCSELLLCNLNDIGIGEGRTVINAAKAYGDKYAAIGRLMTREELGALVTLPSENYYGSITGDAEKLKIVQGTYSSGEFLIYWMGYSYSDTLVAVASGASSTYGGNGFLDKTIAGVRPVIEISKTLVNKVE